MAFSSAAFASDEIALELEYKNILGNELQILVPSDFKSISSLAEFSTHSAESAPDLLYANKDKDVLLSFTYAGKRGKIKSGDLLRFKALMKMVYSNMYKGAKWHRDGVEKTTNTEVGYFEVVAQDKGIKKYNLIFFMPVNGRFVIAKFIAPSAQEDELRSTAWQIMRSVNIPQLNE